MTEGKKLHTLPFLIIEFPTLFILFYVFALRRRDTLHRALIVFVRGEMCLGTERLNFAQIINRSASVKRKLYKLKGYN